MKTLFLAAAAMAALSATAAQAQDYDSNYSGFYVGGYVGGAMAADHGDETFRFDRDLDGEYDGAADDFLVFYEFGADFLPRCERAGFEVAVLRHETNPALLTFTARRRA